MHVQCLSYGAMWLCVCGIMHVGYISFMFMLSIIIMTLWQSLCWPIHPWCMRSYNGELNKRSVSFGLCIIMHVEQSDREWPQPMCAMVKRYITLINDSKTLGERFQFFWSNRRGQCYIMFAFGLQDRIGLCNCAYEARALCICRCYSQKAWTRVV